jgi:hypothetical protein
MLSSSRNGGDAERLGSRNRKITPTMITQVRVESEDVTRHVPIYPDSYRIV